MEFYFFKAISSFMGTNEHFLRKLLKIPSQSPCSGVFQAINNGSAYGISNSKREIQYDGSEMQKVIC